MASFLNLKAVLGLNWSGFQIGLKQATTASQQFADTVKNKFANAFGYAAIAAYTSKLIEFADYITDLSDQLEISTDTLQKWGAAAKMSGSNLEAVAKFFEHLAAAREQAMNGDSQAQSDFWSLGIKPQKLSGMNLQQVANQIANSTAKNNDIQDLIPALKRVGGKGITELIPTLKQGMDGIAESAKQAGDAIEGDVLQQLKAAKSEVQAMAETFKGPMATGIAFIAKKLREVFDIVEIGTNVMGGFFGALISGSGFKDALKIAKEMGDEATAKAVARDDALNASTSGSASRQSGYDQSKKNSTDKLINFYDRISGVPQKGGTASGLNLTENQRAGAFVRFDPGLSTMRDIERNTARTYDELRELKVIAAQRLSGNGIFGAKEEW